MKNKSPKIHHFYDEIYRQNHYVLKAAKPDALIDFAKSETGEELEYSRSETAEACCWSGESGTYIWIGITAKDRSSIIAHECAHAAIATLYAKGLPIIPDTQEAFCYYLQYLVRQVTSAC